MSDGHALDPTMASARQEKTLTWWVAAPYKHIPRSIVYRDRLKPRQQAANICTVVYLHFGRCSSHLLFLKRGQSVAQGQLMDGPLAEKRTYLLRHV